MPAIPANQACALWHLSMVPDRPWAEMGDLKFACLGAAIELELTSAANAIAPPQAELLHQDNGTR
jgi:hypothetical protein